MTATVLSFGGHQTAVASSGHRQKINGPRAFTAALVALLAALLSCGAAGVAARQSGAENASGFVNIALPPGGELTVENRRGGVQVEVWTEDQVALAATVQGQKRVAHRRMPVGVENAG